MPEARGRHAILYDGVCALCDRLVRFVLRHDRRGTFRFAPLQGAFARERLRAHGEDPEDLDTLWVLKDAGGAEERALSRGDALVFVLRNLGFPWNILSAVGLLPRPALDRLYDRVARLRYRVFGRFAACPAPPTDLRGRFVETGVERSDAT